jgi:5-methylcytosine-specific restriction endonuclease McrA
MAVVLSRVSRIQGKQSRTKEAYGSDWQFLSNQVRDRSTWSCSRCGKSCADSKHLLHSHHIIPLSKGGANSLANLVALCVDCHKEEHQH